MNDRCQGNSTDAFYAAVWSHEGYGGPGAGHQAYGEAAAAINDPRAAVEDIVAPDAGTLDAIVLQRFSPLSNAIDTESARVEIIRGNYPASDWWTWDPAAGTYSIHTWAAF